MIFNKIKKFRYFLNKLKKKIFFYILLDKVYYNFKNVMKNRKRYNIRFKFFFLIDFKNVMKNRKRYDICFKFFFSIDFIKSLLLKIILKLSFYDLFIKKYLYLNFIKNLNYIIYTKFNFNKISIMFSNFIVCEVFELRTILKLIIFLEPFVVYFIYKIKLDEFIAFLIRCITIKRLRKQLKINKLRILKKREKAGSHNKTLLVAKEIKSQKKSSRKAFIFDKIFFLNDINFYGCGLLILKLICLISRIIEII